DRSAQIDRLERDELGRAVVVDLDPELLLDRDQFPVVATLPAKEPLDHLVSVLALSDAVPDAAEVKPVPDLVDPPRDVGLIGTLRDQGGGRVDHGPEVAGDGWRARADRRLD